jgi:hypothetical protein
MPNKGDEGEVNIIKCIFRHRNNKEWVRLNFGYESSIRLIIPINYIRHKGNPIYVECEEDIQKAGGSYKADIVIEFIELGVTRKVSIKCFDGAAPTLMNHTHRTAKCWRDLDPPDTIVNKMNALRKSGTCREDIKLPDIQLSAPEITHLKKILFYFVSIGTGARISKVKCDSILYVKDGDITHFYSSVEDYVDMLVTSQKLVLSMRSKGYTGKKALLDRTWVYEELGKKPKGSLNIRLST